MSDTLPVRLAAMERAVKKMKTQVHIAHRWQHTYGEWRQWRATHDWGRTICPVCSALAALDDGGGLMDCEMDARVVEYEAEIERLMKRNGELARIVDRYTGTDYNEQLHVVARAAQEIVDGLPYRGVRDFPELREELRYLKALDEMEGE